MADPTNGHGAYKDEPVVADPAARNANYQHTVSQVPSAPMSNLANPGPLGLIGFAMTTFVLGLYQCGAGLPHSNPEGKVGPDQAVFGLALFMGGLAQFVAGVMEYTRGNTFGTTVHCSYGAFWFSFAMFLIPGLGIKDAYAGDARAFSFALGIYLLAWCFLTIIFLVAALRTNWSVISVFLTLTLAFFFLSIAQFIATSHPNASVHVNKTGGAFAVICSMTAFYAGASGLMIQETTFVRLPLGIIARQQQRAGTV